MGTASLRWPDKKPLKSAGGWRYPNGVVASSSAGAWYYPNKTPAKSAQRAWRYPDDNPALSVGGQWRTPYGKAVSLQELRAWAKDRVPPSEFTTLDGKVGAGRTDEEIVAALELAWRAR